MKALMIFFLLATSIHSKAQTWDEFFRQKKTQKRYLLQQIAALKMYAAYLSKGYDIANKGLKTIKGFTKGEFDIHSDFFNSLKMVNPAIAGNKKVQEMLQWQLSIIKNFDALTRQNSFSNDDLSYCKAIRSKVLGDCERDVEEVLLVITSGKLEMKDDERIKRVDKLHLSMQDKFQFTRDFASKVKILSIQREQERRNSKVADKVYQ